MTKDLIRRNLAREESNKVTFARQELERILSALSQQPAPSRQWTDEENALQFAYFISNNGYVNFDKYYWTNDDCQTRVRQDELYQLFLKQQP